MAPSDDNGDDLEDFWEAVRPGVQDLEAYWSSVRPQQHGVLRHPGGVIGDRPQPEPWTAMNRLQDALEDLTAGMIRPWDDESIERREMDDDDVVDLWQTTLANEFIYAIRDEYIIITPRDHFIRTGAQYDGELFIDHLLPPGLDQVTEGTFVLDSANEQQAGTIDEELARRGFIPSPELQAFIDREPRP